MGNAHGKHVNLCTTLKRSNSICGFFDPFRVASIVDSDPVALPPAIQFVRCANALSFLCNLSLTQSLEGSYFGFVVDVARALAQPFAILLKTGGSQRGGALARP